MWRHGDILVAAVTEIPEGAKRLPTLTLALGELTGHRHRIEEAGTAELLVFGGESFLRVSSETACLVHEEHGPITLPRGTYRYWFQREYSPEAIRIVRD